MSSAFRTGASSSLVSSWSAAAKGKGRSIALPVVSSTSAISGSSRYINSVASPQTATPTQSGVTAIPSSSSSSSDLSHVPEVDSTASALTLLKSQPSHYIIASLVGRTFLLSPRDVFTIPRLRDVEVGDVLELDRIHEVGSRDYTLRAQDPMSTRQRGAVASMRRSIGNSDSEIVRALLERGQPEADDAEGQVLKTSDSWATRLHPSGLAHVGAVLPETTVRARCVVVEHTKGALEKIVKFKRRKDYKKTIEHKQPYTRIRLEAIKLGEGQ